MISLRPGLASLQKLLRRPFPDIVQEAAERWSVAPGSNLAVSRSICLPGQYERIAGTETMFGSMPDLLRHLRGDYDSPQPDVTAFRLRDVHVIDGVVLGKRSIRYLRRRTRYTPVAPLAEEHARGAFYETWNGNRWFGSWLMEDCTEYPLAAAHGQPVATGAEIPGHAEDYAQRLGMTARRFQRAHFDEAVFFHDTDCAHRRERASAMRARLIGTRAVRRHPGVMLLRGAAGDRRLLVNELELAERLQRERGFTIIDPVDCTLDQIIDACAGARVVTGVEGSQLAHGVVLMPDEACLLILQPPTRVVSVYKMVTDRTGQSFAFVVGTGDVNGFTVRWEELDATLDLPGVYR